MNFAKTLFATSVLAAGLVAAASPAAAVVTTFASFNASSAGNVFWVNNGTGGSSTTYRSNGLGGTIATTNSAVSVRPANAIPGGVAVSFSFLNSLSSAISNAPAIFTLSLTLLVVEMRRSPLLPTGTFTVMVLVPLGRRTETLP